MTSETQAGRDAVDWFTGKIKEHEEKKGNTKITETEARAQAIKIAERADLHVRKTPK